MVKDLIASKGKRGRHHYPSEEERAARDALVVATFLCQNHDRGVQS